MRCSAHTSAPLRLLAGLTRFSVTLIPGHRGHHPRQARSPALPTTTSLTSRPDDPGKSICNLLLFGSLADGSGLPHLTTGSALSITSYEPLWVPWWYGLRVCDSSSEKVFSIHSVLRVASQNRIFASGVYRQFPAPDFNRLVAMLPRHTVRVL